MWFSFLLVARKNENVIRVGVSRGSLSGKSGAPTHSSLTQTGVSPSPLYTSSRSPHLEETYCWENEKLSSTHVCFQTYFAPPEEIKKQSPPPCDRERAPTASQKQLPPFRFPRSLCLSLRMGTLVSKDEGGCGFHFFLWRGKTKT